jgi:hypothetical protein
MEAGATPQTRMENNSNTPRGAAQARVEIRILPGQLNEAFDSALRALGTWRPDPILNDRLGRAVVAVHLARVAAFSREGLPADAPDEIVNGLLAVYRLKHAAEQEARARAVQARWEAASLRCNAEHAERARTDAERRDARIAVLKSRGLPTDWRTMGCAR